VTSGERQGAHQEPDSGSFKLPGKPTNMLLSLVAASLLPTSAFGVVVKTNATMSDKLDSVISRLDKIEGANLAAKVEDHESRLRGMERRLDVVEAKGGAK